MIRKLKMRNSKLLVLSFGFAFYALSFAFNCYAKEVTLLYTGETHAMLYPCSCPMEPDGGVARRATLIKQLKKKYPDALVLDSGAFSAGGLQDEYTLNTDLDKQRTLVNLKAMDLMKYDAVVVGDDEFNFGRDFFQENIAKSDLNFLSSNVAVGKILPYIIKDVAGVKVGIIGVTSPLAAQKAGGLDVGDPKKAVAEAIAQIKKNGANIIVLLSHLGESEDLNLINNIQGIDILIVGHSRTKEQPFTKVGNTLVLRPSWQGRHLGKLVFSVKDNKVINPKIEDLRLSDKIADDKDILSILPRCFSDNNCKKEGLIGICQNPGSPDASCLFTEANKVNLTVITPRNCITCDTELIITFLRKNFAGLAVTYLYYPDKGAEKLIKDFAISGLPAYFLGREIEKEKNFDALKQNLEAGGDFYMLKPEFSGISYFLNREKIKGKLDLFISLHDKDTVQLLDAVREFNPAIHFLVVEAGADKFDSAGGNLEVEESLRAVSVQKYYPKNFWDYISCRAKNKDSSWWEDCASGLDTARIKTCAKGNEGSSLLKENISLNRQLQVMFGPTYLLDNQEIFASKGAPSKEELRKIIKR